MKFLLIVLVCTSTVYANLTLEINSTTFKSHPIDLDLTEGPQFLDFIENSTKLQDLDFTLKINNSTNLDDINSNSTVRKTRSYSAHDNVFNIQVEEPRNSINNQNFGQNPQNPPQNLQNPPENPQNTHYTMTEGEKGSDFHSELTGSSSTYQINPTGNVMNSGQNNNNGEIHQIHHSNGHQPIIIKCQAFARAEAGTSTSTSTSNSNSNEKPSNSNVNIQNVPPKNGRFKPRNQNQNQNNQNRVNPRGHHEVSFSMRPNQMANFAREARVPISNLIHQVGNHGQNVRFSTPNGIRHEESSFLRPSSY